MQPTRSYIIVQRTDGTWARIYCHFDGYPAHNGMILFDEYTSQHKAEQLVALGDLATLGAEIGEKTAFEFTGTTTDAKGGVSKELLMFLALRRAQCVSYGRDRGDTGRHTIVGDTLFDVWPSEDTSTEFTYVWADFTDTGPCWSVANSSNPCVTLVDLGDLLSGHASIENEVVDAIGKPQTG